MDRVKERHLTIHEMIVCLAVIFIAFSLKYIFARAGSDELLWILAPTAFLTELVTGVPFTHEPPLGFINTEMGITIAPVCSGINFLILSLCMVFFSFAGRRADPGHTWRWLAVSIAIAYSATLFVNAARIAISIPLITSHVEYGWLTPDRIHRIAGILVYCSGLFGLYAVMDSLSGKVHRQNNSWYRKKSILWAPLSWYFLVTILVPLVTGNYRVQGGRFIEHAVTVLIAGGAILGISVLIRSLVAPGPRSGT